MLKLLRRILCICCAAALCGCANSGAQSSAEETQASESILVSESETAQTEETETETASETDTETESSEETESETESVSETESDTEEQITYSSDEIYAYKLDLSRYVVLGEYRGLEYTLIQDTISDEEMQAIERSYTEQYAENYPQYAIVTDRAAEYGDTVNIDYAAVLNGEPVENGSGVSCEVVIGSGTFMEGFEESIIGVMPGESCEFTATLPGIGGSEQSEGKKITYSITVNYIKGEQVIPEFDDDFVALMDISGVSTVSEFEAYLRQKKLEEAESSKQSELLAEAAAVSEILEYPSGIVYRYTQKYLNYYSQAAEYYYGLDLETYISLTGMTMEEFQNKAAQYGRQQTAYDMVLCAVVEAEGIDVTWELIAEREAEYSQSLGFIDVETFEAYYGLDAIIEDIYEDLGIEVIEQYAVGVEMDRVDETEETELLDTELLDTEPD
ncbi:MAG: FKBP-type peptidyl-prolyl cis-trans isomerase [Lachnospiraceae bacterium]|nr:FKBP-type peptidyl-prolyl cis-trans isomerase [Lachnospiraceae bacterium]